MILVHTNKHGPVLKLWRGFFLLSDTFKKFWKKLQKHVSTSYTRNFMSYESMIYESMIYESMIYESMIYESSKS